MSKLVHSKFGTQQLECWNLGVYYQKSLRNLLDRVESMYTSMSLLCISLRKASISQLPDMSRRLFAISVTASMQTQETKWNDSDQAFISKSRSWRISTIIDQLEPVIDDPLLLSDYPTQEKSDLPAMRAWISASTSPPGGVLDAMSARPTAGRLTLPNSLWWTSSWTGQLGPHHLANSHEEP